MPDQTLSKDDLQKLRNLLTGFFGVDVTYYTENFLNRRVAVRMRTMDCDGPSAYIARLERDPQELQALVSSLTVNVTEFFRDADVYDSLRANILPLLMQGPARRIQAWSAGCATGEEPYTLAMLFEEALLGKSGYSYVIHASDISPRQVKVAQDAIYPTRATTGVPARLLQKSFVNCGPGQVKVAPELRSKVRFHLHDLSTGQAPPMGTIDLVLCRNVMIYFSPEAKDKLLEFFHRTLTREGFLVLGGSEVILKDRLFKPVDPKNKIYRAVPRPAATS